MDKIVLKVNSAWIGVAKQISNTITSGLSPLTKTLNLITFHLSLWQVGGTGASFLFPLSNATLTYRKPRSCCFGKQLY